MSAEDVEWTLGILLAAGHDPAHLLSTYTFEQLALFARSIIGHQMKVLNLLLSPMLAANGIDYKPGKVDQPKAKQRQRTPEEEEQRDAALLMSIGHSPFRVKTVETSGKG